MLRKIHLSKSNSEGREKKLGHCSKSQKDELNTQRRFQELGVLLRERQQKGDGRKMTTHGDQRDDKAEKTIQVLHI